jgi:prephenate dehydratase
MALAQSQIFLSELEGVTVTEYRDTASCAKIVGENKLGNLAVIAGPAVGEKYNLSVIVDKVGDAKENFTRFYILSKGSDYVSNPDKASITLQTKNEPGKLCDVLLIIKNYGLNLTKIQSVPIADNAQAYSFHLDIEFQDKGIFEEALKDLEKETTHLKVLGIYKNNR